MAEKKPKKAVLKRWIALLLAASCIAVILLHINEIPEEQYFLTHSDQADSLITATLAAGGIPESRYRTRRIEIDSLRWRREYIVDLPPGGSSTLWHIRLDEAVRPYGLQTPSKVQFPEMNLRIHLTYGTNVIRSVILQQSSETGN